ncbi:hypothetical protein Ahy_B02g057816 [Arachis hypogaea]|uniref:Uncharacterized protein n=1 Tax=Arachis hypogaea TaxID=3818 RepID=A0A445AD22_ARAHY|nr:hypothetical protein Ahy_B02g057816 [Arachis hypogaea]
MFRRLRWFVGLNKKNLSTKRLGNLEHQPGPERPSQLPVLDNVHEVAVYIHRFHNLDLFEQGWVKILFLGFQHELFNIKVTYVPKLFIIVVSEKKKKKKKKKEDMRRRR